LAVPPVGDAVAAPPVAVEPPPVALEVAAPLAGPAFAFWLLLFEPLPPLPPVTTRATSLYAVLHCDTLFDWELVLLPEFVADAPLDCVVAPCVDDGLLLFVVFSVVLPLPGAGSATAALVPTPNAATAIEAAITVRLYKGLSFLVIAGKRDVLQRERSVGRGTSWVVGRRGQGVYVSCLPATAPVGFVLLGLAALVFVAPFTW
jgi:hypothetical protein